MSRQSPNLVILGGPNGAGKTTVSRAVLADTLGLVEFVNADDIARGLSGFDPDRAAIAAGRIMLERIHELGSARANFCFETTLASRSFAPFVRNLKRDGYLFHLHYVWLKDAELCIQRVHARVRKGGHNVPVDTIRRRYARSIYNLVSMYLPLADSWTIYNNSVIGDAPTIARRALGGKPSVARPGDWERIQEIAHA